jgi:hypothetical protein
MKIIVQESQFKTLLKEDMGVSRASVDYANIINTKLTPYVIDFAIRHKKTSTQKITIGIKDLSRVWKDDLDSYIEFPIEEIRIDLNLKSLPSSQMTIDFATGGAAEQIQSTVSDYSFIKRPSKDLPKRVLKELDDVLNAKFVFDVYVNKDFNPDLIDDLLMDLRDTIAHECNHMLEFYKRSLSGAGVINTSLSHSGRRNYNIPREIFEVWDEFMNMVYFSEPYEMRAMTQEMYSVRLRQPFEEFKKHRYYQAATIMEQFNADTMFDVLVHRIEEHNPNQIVSILSNLYKWFLQDYYIQHKVQGLEPNKRIEKSAHLLDLMKRFQPRINNAGTNLKKRFNKLYSLNPN